MQSILLLSTICRDKIAKVAAPALPSKSLWVIKAIHALVPHRANHIHTAHFPIRHRPYWFRINYFPQDWSFKSHSPCPSNLIDQILQYQRHVVTIWANALRSSIFIKQTYCSFHPLRPAHFPRITEWSSTWSSHLSNRFLRWKK